jgi:hypothetical protein
MPLAIILHAADPARARNASALASAIPGARVDATAPRPDEMAKLITPELVQIAKWPEGDHPLARVADKFAPMLGTMHVRQVCNAVAHARALAAIGNLPTPGDWGLVLEDDALYVGGDAAAGAAVSEAAAEAATRGADVVMLGLPGKGASSSASRFQDTWDSFTVLPACDSYLVTARAARLLAEALAVVRLPHAAALSAACQAAGLIVLTRVPNLFVDGSKLGAFPSGLEANNPLVWNMQYCVATDALERRDFQRAHDAWAKDQFKSSPDALALRARVLVAEGDPAKREEAMAMFERAYHAYVAADCLMAGLGCRFLRDYMTAHRPAAR